MQQGVTTSRGPKGTKPPVWGGKLSPSLPSFIVTIGQPLLPGLRRRQVPKTCRLRRVFDAPRGYDDKPHEGDKSVCVRGACRLREEPQWWPWSHELRSGRSRPDEALTPHRRTDAVRRTNRHRIAHNTSRRQQATELPSDCHMARTMPSVRFRVPFDQHSSRPTVFEIGEQRINRPRPTTLFWSDG